MPGRATIIARTPGIRVVLQVQLFFWPYVSDGVDDEVCCCVSQIFEAAVRGKAVPPHSNEATSTCTEEVVRSTQGDHECRLR